MSLHKTPRALWAAIAILYCIVQWTAARTMAGNTIFSPHRTADRGDIATLITTLQTEITRECTTGHIQQVLFDDNDVFLPYILPAMDTSPTAECHPIRETNITPFTQTAFPCGTLGVREFTPSMRVNDPILALRPRYPGDWTETYRWISPQNTFGFSLSRPTACIAKDKT
jgi:hypothetical protein